MHVAYRNCLHYNVKHSHRNDSDIAFIIIAWLEVIRVEKHLSAITPSDTYRLLVWEGVFLVACYFIP
jgi:hypothetical protein